MKKISNCVKITVPGNTQNMQEKKDRKQQVKSSLNEIQRLSQEIDEQISKNKYSKQQKVPHSQTATKVQQVHEDYEQEDSNYWPDHPKIDSQPTTVEKAIQKSFLSYLYPDSIILVKKLRENILSEQSSHMIDIENYEEYKKVKQFNKDFKQIAQKLQGLRRKGLASSVQGLSRIQNESDVLTTIHQIVKNQSHAQGSSFLTLKSIQKLQKIQDHLQTRLQSLKDSLQFKQNIIEELKTNQKSLQDDIELLQNRNLKLKKELDSIDSVKKFVNSSSQDDEELQEEQEAPQQYQDKKITDHLQVKNEQQNYEKEYLQLMKFYQLYNPQTHQIDQPFPKNKTQAMMLLNKIQTKIQKLEMQKTLSSFQN